MTLRVGNIPQLAGVPYKALQGRAFLAYEENLPDQNFVKLCRGELDAALVPAVDFVTRPDLLSLEFGMGCRSRSDRMLLYARDPLASLDTVHVYSCSRSSLALLRLLFLETFGSAPRIVRHDCLEPLDCIGRHEGALTLHELPSMQREGYRVRKDLAAWWHECTGKPFVFLVWAIRRACSLDEDTPRLHGWLARAAHGSDGMARDFAQAFGTTERDSSCFVGAHRRYCLDEFLMDGLCEFLQRARRRRLLESAVYRTATRPLLAAASRGD